MNAELREWVSANPRAPKLWRELAIRLAGRDECDELWKLMQPLGASPLQILALARDAMTRAAEEMERPSKPANEASQLARVEKKLTELRDAIEQSPLSREPAASVRPITGPGVPDALLALSWTPQSAATGFPAYRSSFIELLDKAGEMLAAYRTRLPPRSVHRRRKRHEVAAFVRWCDWLMGRWFGERPPAAIAHLANAALDLAENPLGPDEVRTILEDSPVMFAAPT